MSTTIQSSVPELSPTSRKLTTFSSARSRIVRRKSQKGAPHRQSGKHWDPVFSKRGIDCDHAIYEDWSDVTQNENELGCNNGVTSDVVPQSEDGENRRSERESVAMLLGNSEASNAVWETKALTKFLSQQDDEASAAEDVRAWAWVDDREISTGRSRDYSHVLDARSLQEILENKRFGHPTLRNVGQRMIYISKLTPSFVSALAKTGWSHQMKALRDAIWKHIALETSLRVQISTLDFSTYQLEFHMAHLFLRPSAQTADTTTNGSIADLSFLKLANRDGQVVPHSIYQGHMSLVICGWSDLHWTGYAFTRDNNGHVKAEGTNELRAHLASEYGFDFAVSGQSARPWDARRYWLRLVAHRCQYVLREWSYLVRTIEEGIEAWKSRDICNLVTAPGSVPAEDIRKSLDKTTQTMQLLRQLRDALSVTLRAYKRFSKSDGDKSYFSDMTDCSSIQSSIFEFFEKLSDLSQRLVSLSDSCKRFATHLGRMISLENNRLLMQTNQLDQESNTHHAASNRLKERMHELSQETVVLNKEMRKLNKRSTEAMCANQAVATKTSRSTRVNIELLLFTTPLAVVLQYFSSVKEILFFKPSPTTLVLATLVLMILLRVLVLAIQHGGPLLRRIIPKLFVHKTEPQQSSGNQSDGVELAEIQNA